MNRFTKYSAVREIPLTIHGKKYRLNAMNIKQLRKLLKHHFDAETTSQSLSGCIDAVVEHYFDKPVALGSDGIYHYLNNMHYDGLIRRLKQYFGYNDELIQKLHIASATDCKKAILFEMDKTNVSNKSQVNQRGGVFDGEQKSDVNYPVQVVIARKQGKKTSHVTYGKSSSGTTGNSKKPTAPATLTGLYYDYDYDYQGSPNVDKYKYESHGTQVNSNLECDLVVAQTGSPNSTMVINAMHRNTHVEYGGGYESPSISNVDIIFREDSNVEEKEKQAAYGQSEHKANVYDSSNNVTADKRIRMHGSSRNQTRHGHKTHKSHKLHKSHKSHEQPAPSSAPLSSIEEYYATMFTLEELHNILKFRYQYSDILASKFATTTEAAKEIVRNQLQKKNATGKRKQKRKENKNTKQNENSNGKQTETNESKKKDTDDAWSWYYDYLYFRFWCVQTRKDREQKDNDNKDDDNHESECCDCICCYNYRCYCIKCGLSDFDNGMINCWSCCRTDSLFAETWGDCNDIMANIDFDGGFSSSDEYKYNDPETHNGSCIGGCICGTVIGFIIALAITIVALFSFEWNLIWTAVALWGVCIVAGIIGSGMYNSIATLLSFNLKFGSTDENDGGDNDTTADPDSDPEDCCCCCGVVIQIGKAIFYAPKWLCTNFIDGMCCIFEHGCNCLAASCNCIGDCLSAVCQGGGSSSASSYGSSTSSSVHHSSSNSSSDDCIIM